MPQCVTTLRGSQREPGERGRGLDPRFEQIRVLADGAAVERMLRRIAHEIAERNQGVRDLALVGVRTGGLLLAERLRTLLGELEGTAPPLGAVDISLYRDDVFQGLPRPVIGPTELPFELSGVTVVLVDDVLYTGRTVRAALDALMDYGRPQAVRLAVLVDRGLRELPISANHVGLQVESVPAEVVKVLFDAAGAVERVVLARRAPGEGGKSGEGGEAGAVGAGRPQGAGGQG
jgi:pyrimidine operon attenuation protein/uracil phosphoribosyltransferase